MGKRARARGRVDRLEAPTTDYRSDDGAWVLTLRGSMTAGTRQAYWKVVDPSSARAAATREDVWHRAVEFLFERLAVRWEIHGVASEGPKELLGRLRVATPEERRFVRDTLRAHVEETFPELPLP
jgi:hypothetical protein